MAALSQIEAKLTKREFEYYLALQANDLTALASFGEDAELLGKSVAAKIAEVEKANDSANAKDQVREHELVIPEFNEADLTNDRVSSVLDSAKVDPPFQKGDIVRGSRVMYSATGSIHHVKGVDRTTTPHTIKILVFGKILEVSRDMVRRIAPMEYDPSFYKRRVRKPRFAGTHAPRDHHGYDPKDD